jgi:SAM-dependent methyltransferase
VDPAEYRKMFSLERTHWWFVAKRRVARTILLPHLPAAAGGALRILDAGCGTGGNLDWLREVGAAVGTDLSLEALAFCRERGHARLAAGRIERLPFADGAFDVVTLFDVLYHRWVADDAATLREVARVTRPGGLLLITDSALPWLRGPHDEAWGGARRYTRRSLRAVLEASGWRARRLSYFHFLLFPLIAAVRLREKWFSAAPARSDLAPVWPPLNAGLRSVCAVECALLRVLPLPWGSSIVCLAERQK